MENSTQIIKKDYIIKNYIIIKNYTIKKHYITGKTNIKSIEESVSKCSKALYRDKDSPPLETQILISKIRIRITSKYRQSIRLKSLYFRIIQTIDTEIINKVIRH